MSDLVERIAWKLKEKGISFNHLERECGLGGGAVKRWNEQSPRLGTLMKVAKYLDVSLDYLAFGQKANHGAASSELQPMLTVSEGEVISMLRELPPDEQEDFRSFLKIRCKRYEETAKRLDSTPLRQKFHH